MPSFFDGSMRAARDATVGASKISLNEQSTPKRALRRESSCVTVRESAPEREDVFIDPDLIELQEIRPDFGQLPLNSERGGRQMSFAFYVATSASVSKASAASSPRMTFPSGPSGIVGTIRIRPGTLNRARCSLRELAGAAVR